MDYILSKIISRPARNPNNHCDINKFDCNETITGTFQSPQSDSGLSDNTQLNIETVKKIAI